MPGIFPAATLRARRRDHRGAGAGLAAAAAHRADRRDRGGRHHRGAGDGGVSRAVGPRGRRCGRARCGDARGAAREARRAEAKTSNQIVVATVKSLNGNSVEDYANRLFRRWQLGQRGKNNGVLLLHAPTERKIRIEVGYGLEGTLTDAIAKYIIQNAITPRFKANDFAGGMTRGVDDIIKVLSGERGGIQAARRAAASTGRPGCRSCLAIMAADHHRDHDGRHARRDPRAAGQGSDWPSRSRSRGFWHWHEQFVGFVRSGSSGSWSSSFVVVELVGSQQLERQFSPAVAAIPAAAARRDDYLERRRMIYAMPTETRIADAIRAAEAKTIGRDLLRAGAQCRRLPAGADRLGGGGRADRAAAADLSDRMGGDDDLCRPADRLHRSRRSACRSRRCASGSCRGA